MAPRHLSVARHWVLVGTALAVLAGCTVWTAPTRAAGPLDKLGTSLNFIPEDAAFYSATLRNGEQIEAVCKSRAWAALKALPAAQDGLKRFRTEIESGQYAPQVKAAWENAEVQSALKLLGDMFSQEVFVYGDQGVVDLIELVGRVSSSVRYGQMLGQVKGEGPSRPEGLLAAALADNIELLKVPNVILGFRVKNRELAAQELRKLDAAINVLLMFIPQLSSQWKRTTIAGNEYLTLTIDGSMIPWDQIPLDEARERELRKGDVDKVVERVKKLKKTIALGLRGDYLLLAVGPSTERLAQLGKGKSLADRPELKPLEKYADRRLVSIGYASQAALGRLMSGTRDVRDLLKAVDDALPKLDLSPDQQAEVRKDIRELTADLNAAEPKSGAMTSFHFLTERGVEGYSYSWGQFPQVDAGKALTLLEHVGGKPILAALGRSRGSMAQYDLAVKWIKRAYHYFEEFGVPQIPPGDREKVQKAVELFSPLVKRWDKANRLLIQATADEQVALVLDAKLQSRQFHRDLPATDRPMPMIEPAMVFGVSDAKRLREAMGEYRAIFNDAVEALRKVVPDPNDIPPLSIPEPKATQTPAGTLYTYEFPGEWGLTKEIVVSLGLSDRVGVAAVTTDHAKRLLRPTPPDLGGVLSDPDRPRAMAASFDWAGLVAAATPWVEFGVRQIAQDEASGAGEMPKPKRKPKRPVAEGKGEKPKAEAKKGKAAKPEAKALQAKRPAEKKSAAEGKAPEQPKPRKASVMDQVRVVLKVLTVIPSITGESYLEGGALVTHTLTEIRDID